MDVYLIRHTRPNLQAGICYGQLDVELAADFDAEARRLAACLALPRGAPVVTPLTQRCRRLAEFLAREHQAKLVVEDRLRELDFGAWEGQPWDAIPRVQTDVWSRDIWNQSAPQGESYASLHERVSAAWEALLPVGGDALLIVGPAGPLRALLTIALELPAEAFVRLHLDYGGIAKLSDSTGGWRLEFSNR
jgi:alpha-ribazole phosphatase